MNSQLVNFSATVKFLFISLVSLICYSQEFHEIYIKNMTDLDTPSTFQFSEMILTNSLLIGLDDVKPSL